MYDSDVIEFMGELWTRKGIEHYLSGHIYSHSAMETADSCGNCDGANCEDCEDIWEVFVMSLPEEHNKELYEKIRRPVTSYRRFTNKEEAIEYFESA